MDFDIRRPLVACARTGRPFTAGEPIHSALVRGAAGLERIDVAAEAWNGPPEHAIAWWRSSYPTAETAGATLAPPDVLLDLLGDLEGRPDDEPLRYLLALQLLRRRVLRSVEETTEPAAADVLVLECRRREAEYRVRVVPPEAAADAAVRERLTALLWSGEAA